MTQIFRNYTVCKVYLQGILCLSSSLCVWQRMSLYCRFWTCYHMSRSRSVQWCQKPVVLSNYLKYFMCNPEPFNSLEQSTTQSFTIVCIIEPHETQQHTLDLPSKPAMHCWSNWFSPSQHHFAQEVNEMNHWDKKKFLHSNDLWAC